MAITLPLSVGCTATDSSSTHINGKIKDGQYHDPFGRFSIKVPYKNPRTIDQIFQYQGTLTFHDEFGHFIRIDLIEPSTPEDIQNLQTANWQKTLTNQRNFMGRLYKTVVPNVALVYQEYLPNNKPPMDFYIFELPNGSSIIKQTSNNIEGERLDAWRGSLSFTKNGTIYVITSQVTRGGLYDPPSNDKQKLTQHLKNTLLQTVQTMKFYRIVKQQTK